MNPKDQLQSGNDYTPSSRAKSAVSKASGSGGYKPDHADDGGVAKKGGDMPKQDVGGSPPKASAQYGSDKLDNPSSINDRRA